MFRVQVLACYSRAKLSQAIAIPEPHWVDKASAPTYCRNGFLPDCFWASKCAFIEDVDGNRPSKRFTPKLIMGASAHTDVNLPRAQTLRTIRKFHPDFSFLNADIALRSLEGTLYRIHSQTLRTTSGLFNTIFSLPQPVKCSKISHAPWRKDVSLEEIPVYETDFVLQRLLRLLCGYPAIAWESFDEIESMLLVAEKWDTPGPIATIRATLSTSPLLTSDPLRLYVLARHFGWREEAKLASTHTLKLNLRDPVYASTLSRLSHKELFRLLDFHRKRHDMFKKLVDSPARFTVGNWSVCFDGTCLIPSCTQP